MNASQQLLRVHLLSCSGEDAAADTARGGRRAAVHGRGAVLRGHVAGGGRARLLQRRSRASARDRASVRDRSDGLLPGNRRAAPRHASAIAAMSV